MIRFKTLLFIFIFTIGSDIWELRKDKENIEVYTRRITTSDFKEIKCKTTVKSSLSSIVKVLTDAEHYTRWVDHCITSNIVKKINDTDIYSYQLLDAPWPADDRDLVSHARVIQDEKTKIVAVMSDLVKGMIPEKDGIVRVKEFHSIYTLTPKGNGFVTIDYEMGTDPGGIVPAWLVNLVIVKAPFDTQHKLNALLGTPEYKTVKLSFITEP